MGIYLATTRAASFAQPAGVTLPLGVVADGQVFRRVGNDVVGNDLNWLVIGGVAYPIGAVADGQILRRVGANIVGGNEDRLYESGGTTLPLGAILDGMMLRRVGGNLVGRELLYAEQTADLVKNTDNTYSDCAGLAFTLRTGIKYLISFWFYGYVTQVAGNIVLCCVTPNGETYSAIGMRQWTTAQVLPINSQAAGSGADWIAMGSENGLSPAAHGSILLTTTGAGVFKVRMRQAAAIATDTIMYAKSRMTALQVP